jgi:hypothetical protein
MGRAVGVPVPGPEVAPGKILLKDKLGAPGSDVFQGDGF